MKYGKNLSTPKVLVITIITLLVVGLGNLRSQDKTENHPNLTWQKVSRPFHVTCLVYHRFGDSRYPSTNTPEDSFEAQLKYLKQQGFRSYTVSQLLSDTTQLADTPKKVLITIDDGFASFMMKGLPLLKRYHMTATLFVNTQSVGWPDYLDWDQIDELRNQGIEIGNHSHKHAYFIQVPAASRASVFEEDLRTAESLFREHLGFVPKTYVYPYGEYSSEMIEILKKRGYQIAFAQNSGVMCNHSHPYAVPRFPMAGQHLSISQFTSKVNMLPLEINPTDQLPIQVQSNQQLHFSINRMAPATISPINCFVAGHPSPNTMTQQGDTLSFSLKISPYRRRTLVTITTQNREGKWLWYSKLLINSTVKE